MGLVSSRVILFGLATLLLMIPVQAQDATSTKALHDLFAREWEYGLRENPTRASQLGDRRWNDRWRDVSAEARNRRHAHAREVVAEIAKINRGKLSVADQLNYDLFK